MNTLIRRVVSSCRTSALVSEQLPRSAMVSTTAFSQVQAATKQSGSNGTDTKEEDKETKYAQHALSEGGVHVDPFDQEFDRFNGSEMQLLYDAYHEHVPPLDRPVDLTVEMDNMKSPDEGNGSIIEELYGKQEKKVSPKKEEQNTPVGPVYDDEM